MEDNIGGRPTKYKPEFEQQVYKLCLLGATDEEIADFFNVSKQTIYNWKEEYQGFFDSIKRGKIEADAEVAESLFKRATGFYYDEVTFEKVDNKVNLEVTTAGDLKAEDSYKKKVVTKLVVADVAAQNIWLKNRRGKVKDDEGQRWADKHEHVHSTKEFRVDFGTD